MDQRKMTEFRNAIDKHPVSKDYYVIVHMDNLDITSPNVPMKVKTEELK